MPSLFPGRGHGSWVQTAPTVPADASPIPRRSFMQTSDITMKVSLPENIDSLMSGLMRTRQPFVINGLSPASRCQRPYFLHCSRELYTPSLSRSCGDNPSCKGMISLDKSRCGGGARRHLGLCIELGNPLISLGNRRQV